VNRSSTARRGAADGLNQDIQFLRAVAILFTLFQHMEYLLYWGEPRYQSVFRVFGFWSGVDLFFCISGFVIMRSMLAQWRSHCAQPLPFARFAVPFWTRRAWRLWPAAWLWAILPIGGALWFNQSGAFGAVRPMLLDAAAAVLQIANFHWVGCYHYGTGNCNIGAWLLIAYWSLSLEEQFYFLFPIVLFFARPRLLPWLLALLVVVQLPLHRAPLEAIWFFRTDALLIGILLALWTGRASHRAIEPRLLRRRPLALIVVLGLLLAVAAVSAPHDIGRFTTGAIALLCGVLVWLASYDRDYLWPRGVGKRFMSWCGARSYTLYLIHMPVYALTREIWARLAPGEMHAPGYVLTALLLMVAFAEANYRLVEWPSRERGRRIARRMMAAPEPAAAVGPAR